MSEADCLNYNQVTEEELETILMLTRKMDGGRPCMYQKSELQEVNTSLNKRKRGKPQRALTSSNSIVPVGSSNPRYQFESNLSNDKETNYYYYGDQRSYQEQEQQSPPTNIMSIQNMLNSNNQNNNNPPEPVVPEEYEGENSKRWKNSSDKYKRIKGSFLNEDFTNQPWQDTLDKALMEKREKEMLDELATILEMPTKNFPHNTARLCYAKLEALKLLRETCNRGLISEELYSEKQQEFLDSMQF